MRNSTRGIFFSLALLLCSAGALFCAPAPAGSLTCVGLYSETSDGYVSARPLAGKGDWTPIKVGDVVPAGAEIKINVERDWIEFIASGKPTVVYEVDGPASGEKLLKVADVLKATSRTVSFPKATGSDPDPKFKDKLVVVQYLGRQVYINAKGDRKDIKYGDVMDSTGKVRIIAINNTITLMNAYGKVTTVIGPLNFTIADVLSNKNLYKYLNVEK